MELATVCKQAIDTFGEANQLRQAQEECAELITAISHYLRDNKKTTRIDLINEMADVAIVLEQMKQIFGEVNLQVAMNVKLSRLKEILDANTRCG